MNIFEQLDTFRISTPIGKRKISFAQFGDHEFDTYLYKNEILHLYKDSKEICKLRYDRADKIFRGIDTRGGFCEISPYSNNRKEFTAHFEVNRERELLDNKKTVKNTEKISNIAIITNVKIDGYVCFKPTNNLKQLYDDLFKNGYEYVFNLNTKITPHMVPLLYNLSEAFKNDADSVQICSPRTGSADEVSEENGDWRSFAISSRTWSKIKGKMLKDKKYNFYYSLSKTFREKNLKRLSTNLSRDVAYTPQDSRRKNFKVV